VAKPKTFPVEFESQRSAYFYPGEQSEVTGDILEIGPGNGELLLWHAANDPQKKFVGIEIALWRIRKMIRRIERESLGNVLLIRGNARILLPRYFVTPCFERVYVLFPDPWPKSRHSHQRLLSVEFLGRLAEILKPGGDIVLASDEQPYVDWTIENVSHVPELLLDGSPYYTGPRLIPSGDETWFERLWRNQGKDIFYARMVRRTTSATGNG
jgi:tRNA (guanine-N7-)-methyltransferase